MLARSPVVPFYPFLGETSPTTIHYRKKQVGTLTLPPLLEDLVGVPYLDEHPHIWASLGFCAGRWATLAPEVANP